MYHVCMLSIHYPLHLHRLDTYSMVYTSVCTTTFLQVHVFVIVFKVSSLLVVFYALQDEYSGTPLIVACENNYLQIATFLIQKGTNINHQTKVVHCFYCFHNHYG